MRRLLALLMCFLLFTLPVAAQEDNLVASNVEIITRIDAFGLEEQVIIGELTNEGDTPYANINIYADVSNNDGDVIAEGFGYVVNECGAALFDTPLLPDETRDFLLTIDLFREGGVVNDVVVFPEGTAIDTPETDATVETTGVTQVSDQEVVYVEWENNNTLRYGIGCEEDVFTAYDWYRYNINQERSLAIDAHPDEAKITEAFLRQTGINQVTQSGEQNPRLFNNSHLVFAPMNNRIVYQSDIHTLFTANEDGSFKRLTHSALSVYTLQGYTWSPAGNFVAYYYGAHGEPVRYFTASSQNGLLSALLPNNTPSQTIPGLYNDGRRVIIGGAFPNAQGEEVSGYWLSNVASQARELLFEVDELPGNNYPAPAYYRKDGSTRYFYIVRDVAGETVLQCYYREGEELNTLTSLPLDLATDERAWSWLSPDFNTLAIAADGVNGGLWLVDLNAFDVCR